MLGIVSGFAAVVVMALYINGTSIALLYPNQDVIWLTVPILLYWISRMWVKAHRGEMHDDPVVFALSDGISLLSIAAFVAVMAVGLACHGDAAGVVVGAPDARAARRRRADRPLARAGGRRRQPAAGAAVRQRPQLRRRLPERVGRAVGDPRPRPLHRVRPGDRPARVRSRRDARRDHRDRAAARLVPAGHAGHPLRHARRRRSPTTSTARTTTAPARSASTSSR